MTKRCKCCFTVKALADFPKSGTSRIGTQQHRSICKKCLSLTRVRQLRNHVSSEPLSPHPKDIVRVSVKGWGFVGVFSEN